MARSTFGRIALAAVLCVATSQVAQAGTVTATFTGASPAAAITVKYFGKTINASAGVLNFKDTEGNNYRNFCIELGQLVKSGPVQYTTAAASAFFNGATSTALSQLFTQSYGSVVDGVSAAAFQVAIWEIVSDSTGSFHYDLSQGNFQITAPNNVLYAASQLLAGIDGNGPLDTGLMVWNNGASQDQITVPAPASLLLFAMGSGLLLLPRRRKA